MKVPEAGPRRIVAVLIDLIGTEIRSCCSASALRDRLMQDVERIPDRFRDVLVADKRDHHEAHRAYLRRQWQKKQQRRRPP